MLEAGHVYVIFTKLTKPEPKHKIVVCISPDPPFFVWFNTSPQSHGIGQLPCSADDHDALTRDCYLDLSRVTTFLFDEIASAESRGPLSDEMKGRICELISAGIETLPPRFARIILENLS